MAVLYTPHFIQFFDDNGDPLNAGRLFTYAAGTTAPKATYTTAAGTISNANPVVLDSAGRAVVFLDGSYKFRLETAAGVLIREVDNVSAFTTSAVTIDSILPTQTGNANKILGTNGVTSSWIPATAPTASQLLGRGTTGDIAPITLGTGLSMSGTTLTLSNFSREYRSSETSYTAGATSTFAHGLGALPKMYWVEAVCLTAQGSLAVGDRFVITGTAMFNGAANLTNASVRANSTNILCDVSGNGLNYNGIGLTATNFRLVAVAYT